jgi:hypothetical protein
MNIANLAQDIESEKSSYLISKLQEIRKDIKNKKRLASKTIFHQSTIHENYAFHYGGRSELQFNIGLEEIDGQSCMRFGAAFSLETSQSLPDVSVLFPKIKKFNEFTKFNSLDFERYNIWCWGSERGKIQDSCTIDSEDVKKGNFIFFGKYCALEDVTAKIVLEVFDELLPLYKFVESHYQSFIQQQDKKSVFDFKPNDFIGVDSTKYSQAEREINITLRHNMLQRCLVTQLKHLHGDVNVASEFLIGLGNRVDVVLKSDKGYSFYEIKTYSSARACIREAIGQLLEYSYWACNQRVNRLVVVAEAPLDNSAKEYLSFFRKEKGLPIFYEQIKI